MTNSTSTYVLFTPLQEYGAIERKRSIRAVILQFQQKNKWINAVGNLSSENDKERIF